MTVPAENKPHPPGPTDGKGTGSAMSGVNCVPGALPAGQDWKPSELPRGWESREQPHPLSLEPPGSRHRGELCVLGKPGSGRRSTGQPSASELTMFCVKQCRKQYAHHSAVISRKVNNGWVVPVGKHSTCSTIRSNYPNVPTVILAHLLTHPGEVNKTDDPHFSREEIEVQTVA